MFELPEYIVFFDQPRISWVIVVPDLLPRWVAKGKILEEMILEEAGEEDPLADFVERAVMLDPPTTRNKLCSWR